MRRPLLPVLLLGGAVLAAPAAARQGGLPAVGIVSGEALGRQAVTPEGSVRPDGSNLFDLLAVTWSRTPMLATRVYTVYVDAKRIYRYHESVVVSTENGPRFHLGLARIETASGRVTYDLTLRRKAYELRSGFLHHYRDFRVHDAALARKNYRVTPMGSVLRNNRRLLVFDITPRRNTMSSYRILVDAVDPVVLDQLEFDPAGRVISTVFYDSVILGAAAERTKPRVPWWKPWMKVREYASVAAAKRGLAFVPRIPRTVGEGFRLQSVRTTDHPSLRKRYLVLVYTDGIDTRFVLEAVSSVIGPAPIRGRRAVRPDPFVPVKRYRLGPVTQYHVDYDGRENLVIGTFAENGVPALVEELLR